MSIRFIRTPHGVLALVAAAAALAALAVAALSGAVTQAQAAKPEFKVLFVSTMSGPLSVGGKAENAGLLAGVKTVNATGGILGRRVTVKTVDDAGSGAKAAAAAIQELSSAKYDMVICGMNGATAPACTGAIAQRKMLQMGVAPEDILSDPSKSPNTWVTLQRFAVNAEALVLRLKKSKIKRIALLGGDNAAGREGAARMADAAKKGGITVTDSTFVPVGASDATPQVQKAKSSNPEAVVVMAFNLQNVTILRARVKLGWDIPVFLDPNASSFNYASVLSASERTGISGSTLPILVKGSKASKSRSGKVFLKNVAVYDPKPVLSAQAHMVTYNAIVLTQAAAKKGKTADSAKLVKAMAKIRTVKDAPLSVGPATWYTSRTVRAPQIRGKEFTWFKLGSIVDGFQVPA